MDEAVEDTEAVLAAYRERKRQALEAARAEGNTPVGAVPAAPPPVPVPSSFAPANPRPEPVPHVPAPAAPPAASRASPPLAPPPAPSIPLPPHPASALEVQRPAPLASSPGATLSPLGPVLRLSDALLKDTKVSMRGSPRTRAVGVVLLLLGLVVAVVERRQVAIEAPVAGLGLAAVALVVAGILTAVIGLVWPRSRRLAVRLAASQKEEWKRIQGETRASWSSRPATPWRRWGSSLPGRA